MEMCDAIQAAIIMLGWDSITRSATLGVLLATPPDRLHHAGILAMELERLGSAFKAAAYDIARIMANQYVKTSALDITSAAKVAKLLFSSSSCDEQRSTFISRAKELSVSSLATVLQTLHAIHRDQPMPDGFTSLASTYISRTFSNYSAAERNAISHIIPVFSILLHIQNEELQGCFARAVCATNDSSLLQALTRSVLSMPQNAHVRLLAAARANQLRNPKPVFSNQQPHANVPGHPQVTYFLLSDETTMEYANFNNLNHARNFAKKHFGQYNEAEHHSARADADGRGANACVTIIKTKYYYRMMLEKYERDKAELLSLQPLLDNPTQQKSKRQKTDGNVSVESSVVDLTDESS